MNSTVLLEIVNPPTAHCNLIFSPSVNVRDGDIDVKCCSNGAVTLNITIDVDYNGTKCVCTAVDGNSRVKTEIDLDIIIQCEY
jgi:hypothetical protein